MQFAWLLIWALAGIDFGNAVHFNRPISASRRFMFGRFQPFWKKIFPIRQSRFKRFRPEKPPPPLVMKSQPAVLYIRRPPPPPPPMMGYLPPMREYSRPAQPSYSSRSPTLSVIHMPPQDSGSYKHNTVRLDGFGKLKGERQGSTVRLQGFGRPRPYSIIELPKKLVTKKKPIAVKVAAAKPVPASVMTVPLTTAKKPAMPAPSSVMQAPPPPSVQTNSPAPKPSPSQAPSVVQSTFASRRQPLSDLVIQPVPRVNAGVLPLENEKPAITQVFPPFAPN